MLSKRLEVLNEDLHGAQVTNTSQRNITFENRLVTSCLWFFFRLLEDRRTFTPGNSQQKQLFSFCKSFTCGWIFVENSAKSQRNYLLGYGKPVQLLHPSSRKDKKLRVAGLASTPKFFFCCVWHKNVDWFYLQLTE